MTAAATRTDGADAIGVREWTRRETMQRIRAAADELLLSGSIDDVTTKEVARRAGIGEATLFRHIGTKVDLLVLVYGDRLDDLLDEMERHDDEVAAGQPEPSGADVCARVRAFYRGRAELYLQNPDNAAAYLRQGFDLHSKGRTRTIAQGDRMIVRVARILEFGQDRGVLWAGADMRHVAQNCQGIFIHEVDRTRLRDFAPETIWERVGERLDVQLEPLIIDISRKGER